MTTTEATTVAMSSAEFREWEEPCISPNLKGHGEPFYTNDAHPMDRPFFGCLQPCNSALRRIDFVKTSPVVRIGRGPNNDFNFPGIRISAKPLPPSTLHFSFFPFLHPLLTSRVFLGLIGFNHCQIKWDGCEDSRSNVTVLDTSTNGTWVYVFSSYIYPTFPLLGSSVAARVRSHTHAHARIHRSMGCA